MSYKYDNEYNNMEENLYENDSGFGTNHENKILKEINKNNKHYHTIRRRQSNGKYKKFSFYTTCPQGSNIRNAFTGKFYTHKVGSKDEDLYFKVIISTGDTSQYSPTLFYDSPIEYEKHMNCILNSEIKKVWEKKNIEARIENYK
jgi:hypothetical protein